MRTALHHGIDVYAVYEGYQGLTECGDLDPPSAMIGFPSGRLQSTDPTSYPTVVEKHVEQCWMDRRGLADIMRD